MNFSKIFFFFFEREKMDGAGPEGTGRNLYCMCHFDFTFQDFLSLQGRETFSSLKMKECRMIMHFMRYIIQMDNKYNTLMGRELIWT